MTHLELLVEEPSAQAALRVLVPRICPSATFDVHAFQGKGDLLRKLPQRLSGYKAWATSAEVKIVVLVDRDDDDCLDLKRHLEDTAIAAGLSTLGAARHGARVDVVNRIIVEELEAWFFGDPRALVAAYPRLPDTLGSRANFRDPDAITGGTWEVLERELQRHGYYSAGLQKVRNAELLAAQMDVDHNSSHSFVVFRDALRRLAQEDGAP